MSRSDRGVQQRDMMRAREYLFSSFDVGSNRHRKMFSFYECGNAIRLGQISAVFLPILHVGRLINNLAMRMAYKQRSNII